MIAAIVSRFHDGPKLRLRFASFHYLTDTAICCFVPDLSESLRSPWCWPASLADPPWRRCVYRYDFTWMCS